MRFGAVAVVGLAGMMVTGLVALAQQAKSAEPEISTDQQKAMVILRGMETAAVSACPGALLARQQAVGGGTVWTTALGDRSAMRNGRPTGLGVHVEFEHKASRVKAIELRVSYLPLGLRRMPLAATLTNAASRQEDEQEKTFSLDRVAATRIDGDLLVGPAATITRVRLVSVTFADGKMWREPAEDACAVVPSRMMLVATRVK
jgi:hypothetical protein